MVSIAAMAAGGRRTEAGCFLAVFCATFCADAIPEVINVTPTIRLGKNVGKIRRISRMNTRLLTKAEMIESVHIVRDSGGKRRALSSYLSAGLSSTTVEFISQQLLQGHDFRLRVQRVCLSALTRD